LRVGHRRGTVGHDGGGGRCGPLPRVGPRRLYHRRPADRRRRLLDQRAKLTEGRRRSGAYAVVSVSRPRSARDISQRKRAPCTATANMLATSVASSSPIRPRPSVTPRSQQSGSMIATYAIAWKAVGHHVSPRPRSPIVIVACPPSKKAT